MTSAKGCLRLILKIKRMNDAYKYIVDVSPDFITLISPDYRYKVANSAYCETIGKTPDQIIGKYVEDIWGGEKFNSIIKGYLDRCFGGEEIHYIDEFTFGLDIKYLHVSYYPYRNDKNNITHVLVLSHDITKLGKMETKLANYEFRDPVTGLFNKKSLDLIIDMELEKAKRSKSEKIRAVCVIRIGNLDDIRAKFGAEIANILLENSGIKLKQVLRGSDLVFRYEGNEFIVLLTQLNKNPDSGKVLTKMHEEILIPYRHHGSDISLSCVMGASIYPNDGDDFEELLSNAYSALVEAGKQQQPFLLFDPIIQETSRKRLELEKDLYIAIYEKQFELYYQPIVDKEGIIRGAESLIRWIHPIKGFMAPGKFISFAEDTGLIHEIGKWVLFTAARQLEKWIINYDIYISINLSAGEYENPDLLEILKGLFDNSKVLTPEHLKLEITESEQMKDPEKAIAKMRSMTDLGLEMYIDDFGTGLSSLSYLKRLPAMTVKIDKSFIDPIADDSNDKDFLKNIIDMAKTRGKKIIVEGIETAEQVKILEKMNCDRLQGYFYSKPVTAEVFEQYLKNGGKLPV